MNINNARKRRMKKKLKKINKQEATVHENIKRQQNRKQKKTQSYKKQRKRDLSD